MVVVPAMSKVACARGINVTGQRDRTPLPAALIRRGNKGSADAEEFAALHDDRLFKFSGIAQNLSNSPVEPDARGSCRA